MANFDEDIKRITNQVIEDGTVDSIIRENVVKGFTKAIEDSFSYGSLRDAIQNRVKTILVPFIEGYDMKDYIVKLDTILTDIVNSTCLVDNKKIMENFKELMVEPGIKEIKVSDMFEQYKKYVADHMETSGRHVEWDEHPYYDPMEVSALVEMDEKKSWSSFEYGTLDLKVEEEDQEEELGFSIRLNRYDNSSDKGYDMSYDYEMSVHGMRMLNDFEVYLLRLIRAGVKLIIDSEELEDEVIATQEPEATYE